MPARFAACLPEGAESGTMVLRWDQTLEEEDIDASASYLRDFGSNPGEHSGGGSEGHEPRTYSMES